MPTAPDTEQAAIAAVKTLFPDIGMGIQQGQRPDMQSLLIEARAVVDLIRVASNNTPFGPDELPDQAIGDAACLADRMLEAALLIEIGDFTPKGGNRDE